MTPTPDRREEVIDLAAALFARNGIPGTSMRDLGEAAQMHAGSLYHHFRSKEGLVAIILDRLIEETSARMATAVAEGEDVSALETIERLIRATLAVIEAQPDATQMYQRDMRYLRDHELLMRLEESSAEMRRYWLDALARGVADGTVRDDLPVEVMHRTMREALWASPNWPERAEYDLEAFSELMVKQLLGMLRPPVVRRDG
ncbi:TetR/AcrR family transcriptional regulator [Enemella sp. A6]|uniref:TetR/AcrR family transcriptional regulator n=1 Tax=Enemella sp. A6 TaxID=3440152 RepID=UPI003EBE026F